MPIDTIKPGTKPPDEINVVVEIPKSGEIFVSRNFLSL